MYRTPNTLSENIRFKAAEMLNRHLAAAIDLHAQVKQAHWNLRGPAFIAVHELLDKVAEAVGDYSDTIAERAGALGATAEGTIHVAVQRSFLEQYKLGVADEKSHLAAVTAALAAFGDSARKAIDETAAFGDQDTSDVFTEVSRGIDYQLWLVECQLHSFSFALVTGRAVVRHRSQTNRYR
jgi:starvation-inducible DNA-binding protein